MSAQSKKEPTLSFSDWVYIFTQILAYLVIVVPFRLVIHARRRIPENIRALGSGSLLIANHQSMMDPFVILIHLPFYAFLRVLPLRFPTHDQIFINPFLNPRFFPLLTLLGCYSIGSTSREKMLALFYTRQLLNDGYAVFLFPEGTINREKNVQTLRNGVEFFKDAAHNVIFARTHGFHEKKNLSFLFRKRAITFSEVFPVPLKMDAAHMHQYLDTL